MPPPPPDPRSGPPNRPGGGVLGPDRNWRWIVYVLVALLVAVIVLPQLIPTEKKNELTYGDFTAKVAAKQVKAARVNNDNGKIAGTLEDGKAYTGAGPHPATEDEIKALNENVADLKFQSSSSNFLGSLLPILLYAAVIIGLFVWMSRRAQGQMSGVMSIGRSKAKVFTTDRPRTTFNDVAGYRGVKQEINEVVDFLKQPARFKEIGARIPKGVLLVGPPGTGKTLLARAVAGEAGVPFLSVTGSDF